MLKNVSGIRWIFFDVGYTLFDETPAWQDRFEALSAELSRLGRQVSVEQIWAAYNDLCEQYAPLQWLGLCERLATSPDEARTLAALSTGWKHALETAYPAADAVLNALHGRYKLGVIANQSEGTVRRLAERNLGGYFDLVIGSAEAGVRKPDPAIFRLALNKAGCRADEAVMVGDRIDNDIRPARVLGMRTVPRPPRRQRPATAAECRGDGGRQRRFHRRRGGLVPGRFSDGLKVLAPSRRRDVSRGSVEKNPRLTSRRPQHIGSQSCGRRLDERVPASGNRVQSIAAFF